MKNFKWLLAFVMTALLLSLMDTLVTGMTLHEFIGLGLCLLFILHKLLHAKWIKAATTRFFSSQLKAKVRVLYIVDILLLISSILLLITGVLISQEIFGLWYINPQLDLCVALHHFAGYFILILVSIHVGLHWESIMRMMARLLNLRKPSRFRTWIANALAIGIMILGIRAAVAQNLTGNLTEPFTVGGNDDSSQSNTEEITLTAATENEDMLSIVAVVETVADTSSGLQDYLSKLTCTGCGKHCPLSAPQCSRGVSQASAAAKEYEASLATTTTKATTTTTTTSTTVNDSTSSTTAANNAGNNTTAAQGSTSSFEESSENKDTTTTTTTTGSIESASLSDKDTSVSMTPLTDFLPLMGLFVAGTHYTVTLPRKIFERLFHNTKP